MKNSKSGYSISIKGFLPGLTYMPAETPLHRLHPLIKLELLICYGLLVFALPHYLPGLCLFILLLVAYRATGMGLNFFWRKLRFIIIFGSLIFFVHLIFVHKGVLPLAEYTASQNYHPFLIFSVGARGWRGDLSFATINIPHTKDNAHAYTNPRQT
jgi:energy-coupling factor transporter transmembrane protein EcfT